MTSQPPPSVNDNNANWRLIQKLNKAQTVAWLGFLVLMIAATFLYFEYNWTSLAISLLSGCFSLASVAISKGWIK